ncbi:MAPEG family protein [Paraglaciecola psychrophila]|uniref:Glutathione S-transferase-like protein n=1 Tax=Paraglaciecola psychrophila 170 TaxID=1129794 RepID=K6YX97_9ALTE|nr:MAPEG family protein [Paraglaciecola psychrophila]AGH43924.1 glutathione S-transferase-like protein [Paraglaciecola psychrophila 170]GAC37324.1 inner membrane protein yecN [Paraglaciecola psychrophila 170]
MHTPITAFYAGLLGILFFYYSALVVKGRLEKKIPLGDGGDHHFQQVIRAHGNFSEYTPIVLILLFIAEVNLSHPIVLHLAGSALLSGRFLHAFGMRRHSGSSWQRASGILLTFASLFTLSVVNILILYR